MDKNVNHDHVRNLITPGYLFNSDPDCHVINGRFYIFTSHDQTSEKFIKGTGWETMFDYHCMSTTDFIHWVDHGSILNIHDAVWATSNEDWVTGKEVWDGDAGIYANGKYYAYIPMGFQIGVFVSERPEGPYVDALGKPLISTDMIYEGGAASEASVIIHEGQPYLVYGSGHVCVCKLKPNMIELAEAPVKITVPEDFIESPLITNINGRFYLTYSNGGMWGEQEWNGKPLPPPRIMYSISDSGSIYGPYTGSRILQDVQINPEGEGWQHTYASSAHQGIACYNGDWYFAYHMDYKDGVHRQTCVTKMTVNPDGSINTIDPNTDPGVTPYPASLTLDAFVNRREAEEFFERYNADEENGIQQDYHLKMRDGGYIGFNHMDFGSGAAGFKVEVSCENPCITNGKIEFRLDGIDGPKIGECSICYTKGKTDYVILTGPVQGAKGTHDLYITAHGTGCDASGYLFNINWFTFTGNEQMRE